MIRLADIIIATISIFLLMPVIILISVFILIESKGGVFFVQKRIGKNKKEFKLLKFRTMFVNSDKLGLLTIGKIDPRVTFIGNILRKSKLDEIPQLINVLMGDMSIVGPRPEVEKYVKFYTKEQEAVLSVNPGITDYASLKFANECELLASSTNPEEFYVKIILPEKIKLNMHYIRNQNLIEYFKIIFFTIKLLLFKLVK